MAASGLILASYSTSLATLLLTYSLVTGLGFGETLLTLKYKSAKTINKERGSHLCHVKILFTTSFQTFALSNVNQ